MIKCILGYIEMVFERPSESIYAATTSTLTCSTRSQCFKNEVPIRIEEEYGELLEEPPAEYDPTDWGWDVTSLFKGTHAPYLYESETSASVF